MAATRKQKQAFVKSLENCGNISKSMREVGYSPNTAKNPKILTESKGWKELMDEFIPDSLLAERHQELLNKREYSKVDEEVIDQPETQAVSKGLDMAYKLKGSYEPEKLEHRGELQITGMRLIKDGD